MATHYVNRGWYRSTTTAVPTTRPFSSLLAAAISGACILGGAFAATLSIGTPGGLSSIAGDYTSPASVTIEVSADSSLGGALVSRLGPVGSQSSSIDGALTSSLTLVTDSTGTSSLSGVYTLTPLPDGAGVTSLTGSLTPVLRVHGSGVSSLGGALASTPIKAAGGTAVHGGVLLSEADTSQGHTSSFGGAFVSTLSLITESAGLTSLDGEYSGLLSLEVGGDSELGGELVSAMGAAEAVSVLGGALVSQMDQTAQGPAPRRVLRAKGRGIVKVRP